MPQPTVTFISRGRFHSSRGDIEIGGDELEQIVASYDARRDPAPVVIGEPKLEDPAYGWVDRLELKGQAIVAHLRDVEPTFAESVREHKYKSVKPSLYMPNSQSSPKPGSWYLKSITFIGMEKPTLKIGDVSFSEVGSRHTVSFAGEVVDAGPVRDTYQMMKDLMAANPRLSIGEASEIARVANEGLTMFAAPEGYTVDPRSGAIYLQAMRLRAANPALSMADALMLATSS